MAKNLLQQTLIPLSMLISTAAFGQVAAPAADGMGPVKLEKEAEPDRNRFGLSYRMAFNIKANFKDIGAFNAGSNPNLHIDPNTGHLIRTYDDGYNGVDITDNDHEPGYPNTTWYW